MSEGKSQYLTDESTLSKIYTCLTDNNLAAAVGYLKGIGDDATVMKTWIGIQCDINNIKKDPYASELIAWEGVNFALTKGYKTGAAILLHNISSFHMPNFDEGVDATVIPKIIEASAKQVEIREQLEDKPSLAWAYWDHGLALLAGSEPVKAALVLQKTVEIAGQLNDPDLAAWANLFIGKAIVKSGPEHQAEGSQKMQQAADIIRKVGEQWEKEETAKILASVGLSFDV